MRDAQEAAHPPDGNQGQSLSVGGVQEEEHVVPVGVEAVLDKRGGSGCGCDDGEALVDQTGPQMRPLAFRNSARRSQAARLRGTVAPAVEV